MQRSCLLFLAAAVGVVTAGTIEAAILKPPKGAVRGSFSKGILAETEALARYLKASNIWCAWRGDNVIVHVSLKNTAAEHVTATIKPRYFIQRGGEHGSGLTSAKDYGFDAGEFRSLWIDAGEPEGVKAKTPISRCAPYLFLIESG
jgi:hypothetical protein